MKNPRPDRRALLAIALASLPGCYVQRPLTAASPQPQTRIVAQVTDSGAAGLRGELGPDVRAVEGVIASADATAWSLDLIKVTHLDGRSILWNRERVSFPLGSLSHVTEKRLDKTKSFAAAGIVVAMAVIATQVFNLVGADSPPEPGPVPPN